MHAIHFVHQNTNTDNLAERSVNEAVRSIIKNFFETLLSYQVLFWENVARFEITGLVNL